MSKGLALGMVIGGSVGASLGKSFQTLEERARRTNQNLKKVRIGETLAKDMLRYQKVMTRLQAKQGVLGVDQVKLKKLIGRVGREFDSTRKKARSYGLDLSNLTNEHKRLGREAAKAEREVAKIGKRRRMGQVLKDARGQMAAMAGTGYVMARQAGSAQRFGRVQTRLGTVINADDRGAALAQSKVAASRFARGSLATESEILNSEYSLNSAGLSAEASRAGAKMSHKLAVTTGGLAESVATIVGDVYNNLAGGIEGSAEDKMGRIGDLLGKTQAKYSIKNFDQLGEGIRNSSAAMTMYNMDLDQGLAILGELNTSTMKGAQAGTALTASLRSMSKASDELGFDMARNSRGGLDFIQTMENMSDAIGGFDDMDQATLDQLQKLFGDEGIRGVSLLGARLKELKEGRKELSAARKWVNVNYDPFLKDDQGQWDRLTANIGSLGRSIGTSLMPYITPVVGGMANLTGWLGNVIDDAPMAGVAIGTVAGGFVLYKTVALGAALATGNFGKALDILTYKQTRSAIGRLGKLTGAMKGVLGQAGLLGAAGIGGYAAGTYLNDNVLDKETKSYIGESVAEFLAFFGNDNAQRALDTNAKLEQQAITQTNHFNITTTPNQSPQEIAEAVIKLQQEQQQGGLYDAD